MLRRILSSAVAILMLLASASAAAPGEAPQAPAPEPERGCSRLHVANLVEGPGCVGAAAEAPRGTQPEGNETGPGANETGPGSNETGQQGCRGLEVVDGDVACVGAYRGEDAWGNRGSCAGVYTPAYCAGSWTPAAPGNGTEPGQNETSHGNHTHEANHTAEGAHEGNHTHEGGHRTHEGNHTHGGNHTSAHGGTVPASAPSRDDVARVARSVGVAVVAGVRV